MVRLDVEQRDFRLAVDRLIALQANLDSLPATYQKLVAEVVMVRLFDLFQNHVKRIVCKVACGADYVDGTGPVLLHRSRSIGGAQTAMQTVGRGRSPLANLRWSKVSDIKANVRFVIDPSDHVLVTLDQHGQMIDEMRRVRNRVAHNNDNARKDYAVVVRQKYGARVRCITPGNLLLSPRWSPTLLETYLKSARTLVRTLVRG